MPKRNLSGEWVSMTINYLLSLLKTGLFSVCVCICFYRWHDYLEAQNYVPTTIRNYNIDVKAFLKYLEEAQPSQVRLGNATIRKLMYIIKHIQKRTLRMIPGYRQNQRRKNKSRYFFLSDSGEQS